MRITVDSAGRVVIPKQVRDRLHIGPGSTLELEELGDHVELRPVGREVWIDRSGARPVARTTVQEAPRLTGDAVRELTDRLRG
jgi:AbrB family looped-hinge helix DNA binding protein